MSITLLTVEKSDKPNEGRVKINTNFGEVSTELDKKLNHDGSNAVTANIDMGGNRFTNCGGAVDNDEWIIKSQLETELNKLVTINYAYVVPNYPGTKKNLYLDNTGSLYGIKVGTITQAFQNITDATAGNKWVVVVPQHPDGYWANTDFSYFGDYIDIVGDGCNPNIEVADGTIAGTVLIEGNGKMRNITLIFENSVDNTLKNLDIENVNVYSKESVYTELHLSSIKSQHSKMIADDIILDGTSENFVNFCTLSVDLTGTGSNSVYTYNTVDTNLRTFYPTSLTS